MTITVGLESLFDVMDAPVFKPEPVSDVDVELTFESMLFIWRDTNPLSPTPDKRCDLRGVEPFELSAFDFELDASPDASDK